MTNSPSLGLAFILFLLFHPGAHAQTPIVSCFQSGNSTSTGVFIPNCDPARTTTVFKNQSAVVVTSETTIWTPATGKKFRLMKVCLTQGVVTGAITLKDNTGGTAILVVPQNTIGVQPACLDLGNGILSAAANNVLTATGVSTETITGFVAGTEE